MAVRWKAAIPVTTFLEGPNRLRSAPMLLISDQRLLPPGSDIKQMSKRNEMLKGHKSNPSDKKRSRLCLLLRHRSK